MRGRAGTWISTGGGALALVLLLLAAPTAAQVSGGSIASYGQNQTRELEHRVPGAAARHLVNAVDIPAQLDETRPPPHADQIELVLHDVTVAGSSVYGPGAFDDILKPRLGRKVSLAEIYALAQDIAAKYARDGYAFTRVEVPGQHVTNGRVRLEIVEFKVGAVAFRLGGAVVPTPPALEAAVAQVVATRPLTTAVVDRVTEAARAMRDLKVAVVRSVAHTGGLLTLEVTLARPDDRGVVLPQGLDPTSPPAGADQVRLTLKRLDVTGATVFPAAELAALGAPLVGREVTLAQLYAVASAISERYAAAGYVGSHAAIPAQLVEDGAVTIEVDELAIRKVVVRLDGRPVDPDGLLQHLADPVTREQPATAGTIARQLFILGQVPGIAISGMIPPVDEDRTAEVDLSRTPYSGSFFIDNRGTTTLGPSQFIGMLTENGQLGANEQIQVLGGKTAPWQEMTFAGVNGVLPLSSEGIAWTTSYNHSLAKPGGTLAPYGLVSTGDIFSNGLIYLIDADQSYSWSMNLNLDVSNAASFFYGGRITSSDERTRSLRLGSMLSLTDGIGGSTTIRAVLSQGLNALGARPNGLQPSARPGSRLDYDKATLDIRREQVLPLGLHLSLGLQGQRAFSVLPVSELWGFGGADFGRAYDGGVIAGDHGLGAKAELSRMTAIGLPMLTALQPFVYYDFGESFYAIKIPGQQSSATAASAGFGTRFVVTDWFGGSVELDTPLTRPALPAPGVASKATRVFFTLTASF